jgi:hypothetical protein
MTVVVVVVLVVVVVVVLVVVEVVVLVVVVDVEVVLVVVVVVGTKMVVSVVLFSLDRIAVVPLSNNNCESVVAVVSWPVGVVIAAELISVVLVVAISAAFVFHYKSIA